MIVDIYFVMIKIPMHCLVGLLGDVDEQSSIFPKHEILRLDDVVTDLYGPGRIYDVVIQNLIEKEMSRRVVSRLTFGQRVVINFNDFTPDQQNLFVNLARQSGASVIALLDDGSMVSGKRISGAECINSSRNELLPVISPLTNLKNEWSGITLVGDIHGVKVSLDHVIEWAATRNHLPIFLGDILDYGPSSLEVTETIYGMVMRGTAAMVVGNHERKIAKWADGHSVRLSAGNKVTTTALQGLGDTAKAKWIGRFRALYGRSSVFIDMGNVILAHAAVHPGYWDGTATTKQVDDCAMFGEVDPRSKPDHYIRSYDWVNHIPEGKTVVVGHDCRGEMPVTETGAKGGKVIFLDTGSGKGGRLSTADFFISSNDDLILQNFNIH